MPPGQRRIRIMLAVIAAEMEDRMQIEVRNLDKAYHGKAVLKNVNLMFEDGKIYCLMGASGQGKTTFLRILSGLELPDSGEVIKGAGAMSGVFQEDRLCEAVDAVQNVAMVCRRKDAAAYARDLLLRVLPEDSLKKPVSALSGGMRRRVAVIRALAAESEFVFMDEPFTGLDEDTRRRVISCILELRRGRTLLVVTHQREDAKLLGGEIVLL